MYIICKTILHIFNNIEYLCVSHKNYILAQHHYRLIVNNCGFCPGLMLASAEPEAMKSTAAMIALKAIGDPSAFLELNSTTEYIDLYRDSTSLPLGEFKVRGIKRPHFWLCSTFHEFFIS